MPHSSSNDIIQAALHNIIHALKHPAPKSPIAPQTDSQTQALLQVVDLLHGITDDNKENTESPASSLRVPIHSKQGPASKVLNLESAVPAPSLRVPTHPPTDNNTANHEPTAGPRPPHASHPATKVMDVESAEPQRPTTLRTIKTLQDVDVISTNPLRIALPPNLTNSEYIEDKHGLPTGSLGCDMRPRPTADTDQTAPADQPPRVTFRNPPVSHTRSYAEVTASRAVTDDLTFEQTTGPLGKKHRRKQRKQTTKPKPAKTPTMPAKTPTRPNRTRRNRKHKASSASKVSAPMTSHDVHTFMALHGTAINPDTGNISEYRELSKCSEGQAWKESNIEEIGRMFQGLGKDSPMPSGTNTMHFIYKHPIPKNKTPTYIRVVCADRPEKPNPKRVRWTAGGDRIDYQGNKTCKTADITTAKLMFNSVLSTRNARFMGIDLKDFYLMSELDDYEYMRIPLHMLPQQIIELYDLQDKIIDGYVYAEVRRGMYGLPQAGRLANEQLRAFLEPYGYLPCPITPGLWKDHNSDLMFTLVVDDFGVRYTSRKDVDKLVSTLQNKYKCSSDWEGDRYIGLTLNWDYDQRTCDISMPGYVKRPLQRFIGWVRIRPELHPEHSPHAWTEPIYGWRQQYEATVVSELLDLENKTCVQEVLGTLLYYARAVDNTMLTSIGEIATQQASATNFTLRAITQLLNYAATNPEATIRFHASDMILYVESDASYLSVSKARSRAAGFHYLSDKVDNPSKQQPPMNGPVNILCKILKNVLSSAAEAELAGLFLNGKEAVPERITLEELGHPQPPTPMVTDNSTAMGIANDSVKQKRSKSMDMRFYWIRDRVRQGHFQVFWQPGKQNRADYYTKHHHVKHHIKMRPHALQMETSNRYAPLADYPPLTASKPVPEAGEGVFIPPGRQSRITRRHAHQRTVTTSFRRQ